MTFNPIGNKPWSAAEAGRMREKVMARNTILIVEALKAQPGDAPLTCQEASPASRETFIACGAPAARFVLSERGQKVYPMCEPCATHNVRNRGAEDVGPARREP
ncbi:MAG: hypothetical protein V4510_09925 [bacterium]